jgi:hypothetical protein
MKKAEKPRPKNNIGQLQQELNMYLMMGNDAGMERIQLLIDEEVALLGQSKEEEDE